MTTHFMKSYAELLIKTCHRRNIHAMGGMAAQIPVKNVHFKKNIVGTVIAKDASIVNCALLFPTL